MLTQERRFLYQPSPLVSIINWSWTFMIFLAGVVVWLEITHFQWITFAFFVVFALISWIEIHYRHMVIKDHMLIIKKVINRGGVQIPLDGISTVTTSRYRIGFVANGKIYNFIMPRNSVIELQAIISK